MRRRWSGAVVIVAALAGLTVPPASAGPAEPAPAAVATGAAMTSPPRPVVFVHGAAGSAARFATQAQRFASNGYPDDRIAALEYDSTFATATLADVHERLDGLVADLRQHTGASHVDVVAEGTGAFVTRTWLASAAPRASAVARYVNLDGSAGGAAPEGVAALAVWRRGDRDRRLDGATNLRLGHRTHARLVASAETFAAAFRFLTGDEPRTTGVLPAPTPEITLAGRVVVHPFNVGAEGGTLAVHRVDPRTGRPLADMPEVTFPLGADGTWGPFTARRHARYELVVSRPGLPDRRFTPPPFVRSDHLVRLTLPEPGEALGGRLIDVLGAGGGYASIPGAEGVPSPEAPPAPLDCAGPAPDAEPGTPAWFARDANNLFCSTQRHLDQVPHPVKGQPAGAPAVDAYRDPERHDGVRFRFDAATIAGLAAEVYRPCTPGTCPDLPDGLEPAAPPYPAVVTLHGGGSNKELHRWSSQSLAEAGYLVIAFDGASSANAARVLDWLHARQDLAADFDGRHVGIAGHSIGGDAAADVAHRDPRISAAVYWDRAGLTSPPADRLRVPSLTVMSDYGCTAPLVCPLEVRRALPDPAARGAKTRDFGWLRDAGIDAMQVALRASTHFDFVPDQLSGNRYAELVTAYYTLAWFDRYVRGADDPEVAAGAHARLTASAFDDSADRHNISQGAYDPAGTAGGDPYGGNVPYRIEGQRVADRLSFYYPSRCFLSGPGAGGAAGRAASDDVRREGCRPVG